MWRWVKWAVLAAVCTYAGYVAYDYYRAGLHTRPNMPPGSFSISYKSGFRALFVGVPDHRATRRYLGYPVADVPFYLKEAWSICGAPTDADFNQFPNFMPPDEFPGSRLEAVCYVAVEGKSVMRGLIASVPRV